MNVLNIQHIRKKYLSEYLWLLILGFVWIIYNEGRGINLKIIDDMNVEMTNGIQQTQVIHLKSNYLCI